MTARESLAQEWRERFDDFAYSEMTVQQWCDFNRLPVHKFYYWKIRLKSAHSAQAADVRFVAVTLTDEPAVPPAALTLRIAGAEIDLVTGFNPALLRVVVGALAQSPC